MYLPNIDFSLVYLFWAIQLKVPYDLSACHTYQLVKRRKCLEYVRTNNLLPFTSVKTQACNILSTCSIVHAPILAVISYVVQNLCDLN